MAAIVTMGELQTLQRTWPPGVNRSSLAFYDSFHYDYAALYRLQPNVRVCVDFLARNIAQLGLHIYRRVSDTDRARLTEHPLAQLLARPLPEKAKTTRYRLIESLMGDLGVYYNAYWLKMRGEGRLTGLVRIPPAYVRVHGSFYPQMYELNIGGKRYEHPPEDVVHFGGYNPENSVVGLSPLETLRRVLAEEHAAGRYREGFWKNAARQYGIIRRPSDAPEWSTEARERFLAEFAELYSGEENSGRTAVLEEGMDWVPATFNAQESEYLAGRKLTREECARAYHIPLPLVGILDHATFSNIQEQHKHLYQDSLGPWLAMIEQDIELQLLPDFEDRESVYLEFNIAEKLQGDFEEQMRAFQAAVGRPWMTANEARARMNLPSVEQEDADLLVTPLNVLAGGQASPRDSAPPEEGAPKAKAISLKAVDATLAAQREQHEKKWEEVLARHYRRQEAVILSRVPKAAAAPNGAKGDVGGVWFDEERWNRELGEDLLRMNLFTAMVWAQYITDLLGVEISEGMMLPYLREHSRIQAEHFNGRVRDELETALRDPEPLSAVKKLFVAAVGVWALEQAVSAVTSAANFGAHEGARSGGLRNKRWRVNSSNPRPAHQAMNGEAVPIDSRFSNGMRWPGDPAGGAENNAHCLCSMEFTT